MRLELILTGGQTGVDRAAWDACVAVQGEAAIAIGGTLPRGRWAEDGVVPACYGPLREADDRDEAAIDDPILQRYARAHPAAEAPRLRTLLARTRRNVIDADGLLALTCGPPGGGTRAALEFAAAAGRPAFRLDIDAAPRAPAIAAAIAWIARHDIRTLNVAGPRASEGREVYPRARAILRQIFAAASDRAPPGCPGVK